MKKYIYEGPVTEFGRIIDNCWHGETMAISPSKAKSNLIFRFKKQCASKKYFIYILK